MRTDVLPSHLSSNDSTYIDSLRPSLPSANSHRNRRLLLYWTWTISAAVVFLIFIIICFVYYSAWTFTHPRIAPLYSNPMAAHQLPYNDIEFSSMDGHSRLSGWYIPSASTKTVIFSHGYAGNREEIWVPFYDLALALHQENYNVLMFDYGYVNRKQNPYRVMTAGVKESGELLGAVSYAKELGADQVYIWGFSMGAGTALQAALQPEGIDGMILDSTFLLQPNMLDHHVPYNLPFSRSMFVHMVDSLLPFTGGVKLNQVPYEQVNSTAYSIPLLMIHGQKDTQAPYTITERIFKQQRSHPWSELWLPPDRGHEMTYRFESEQYLERTLYFLRKISQSIGAL
jgi:fermentation-respiration switch protein FrsA (DUF1100 family)